MLVSGGDDQLWPSSKFAEILMERLTCHHHPYKNIHLHYKDAGHFLCFPYTLSYMPPNVMLSPGGGMTIYIWRQRQGQYPHRSRRLAQDA
ncbi:acyl-CoA thioester hydrolase/BAAT C-terminal domain-containing protein [Paenibacillus elgii]|uniref:acyl-CoA thioester hydrolase/BAAT C-terminal domain-containing protein n=1 Tax=Paenibacillus elgii TaxID=189691 RepID=UPI00398A5C60